MKKFNNFGATGSENIIPFSNEEEQFSEPKEEAKIFDFQAEKLKRMTPEEKKSHAGDLYKDMPLGNRKETMAELSEYKLDRNQKGHFLPNHELAAIQANKDFIETQAAEYQNQFKTDEQRDFEQLSSHEPVNNWDKLSFDERQKLGEQGIRDSQDYTQFLEENIARNKESNKISGDSEKNTDKAVALEVPDDVLASIIANNPIDKFSYSEEKGGMKKQSEKAMINEIGSVVGESFSELPERLQKDYLDQVKTYLNGKNNGLVLDVPKFADINKVRQDEERRLGGVFNAEENGSIKSLTEDYNAGKISEEVYTAELDRMSKLSNEVVNSSEQFITEAQRDAAAEKAEKSFFKHPIKTLKRWGATAMKATAVFVGSGFAVGVMNTTITVAKENDNQKAEHSQKIKEENEQRRKIAEGNLKVESDMAQEREDVKFFESSREAGDKLHDMYPKQNNLDYAGNMLERNEDGTINESAYRTRISQGWASERGVSSMVDNLSQWYSNLNEDGASTWNGEDKEFMNNLDGNVAAMLSKGDMAGVVTYLEANTDAYQKVWESATNYHDSLNLNFSEYGMDEQVTSHYHNEQTNQYGVSDITGMGGTKIQKYRVANGVEHKVGENRGECFDQGTTTKTVEQVQEINQSLVVFTAEQREKPPVTPEEPEKPPVTPEEPKKPPVTPEKPDDSKDYGKSPDGWDDNQTVQGVGEETESDKSIVTDEEAIDGTEQAGPANDGLAPGPEVIDNSGDRDPSNISENEGGSSITSDWDQSQQSQEQGQNIQNEANEHEITQGGGATLENGTSLSQEDILASQGLDANGNPINK